MPEILGKSMRGHYVEHVLHAATDRSEQQTLGNFNTLIRNFPAKRMNGCSELRPFGDQPPRTWGLNSDLRIGP